jgi:acyl-CoA reductase-like NAD-dependent aldehyde dehydrogenase
MTLPTYQILIGGELQSADSRAHVETHNPYTGAPWVLIPRCTVADVGRAVTAAKAALDGGAWPAMTATQRGALLRKLGDLIAAQAEQLAQTEVRDNGKLIAEMLGQTRYVPQWYYYSAAFRLVSSTSSLVSALRSASRWSRIRMSPRSPSRVARCRINGFTRARPRV